jgi:hypothetical protein
MVCANIVVIVLLPYPNGFDRLVRSLTALQSVTALPQLCTLILGVWVMESGWKSETVHGEREKK